MKKKFLAIIAALMITAPLCFGAGISNVPSSGREIVIMKGSEVIWEATNWHLEINTAKYTKLWGSGGDDFFKLYTFTGTPKASSKYNWATFTIVDCQDLSWFWR